MRASVCSLFAMAVVLPGAASASPIQVDFTGTVLHVQGAAVGGPILLQDEVTGTFVYETTGLTDAYPGIPKYALYTNPLPILSFDVMIGAYHAVGNVASSEGYVAIDDGNDAGGDDPSDSAVFRTGATGTAINGVSPRLLQFALSSSDLTRISGDDVPTGDELLHFTVPFVGSEGTNFLILQGPVGNRVDWRLTSFTVVPEPRTGTLALFGLIVLASHRRR